MAEDKRSFILYADLIHTVKKLPKMKQADLFMTILRYVNDENPEVTDTLVSVAFEPIKQQLKRDLKNWDKTRKKKSDGGALGNLKRWHPDLFERVQSKEITLEESLKIASDRIPIKNIAPVAVNVNDNVTVTANDIHKGSDGGKFLIPEMQEVYKKSYPGYHPMNEHDFPALQKIAKAVADKIGIRFGSKGYSKKILDEWVHLCTLIREHKFYHDKPLSTIANNIQTFFIKTTRTEEQKAEIQDVAAIRKQEEERAWRALNGG